MTTTITDWTDLDNVRNNLSDDYVLANDLDQNTAGYSGIGDDFDPIGQPFGATFDGTFDGQDNTIRDLVIAKSNGDSVGLFGNVDGTVENLVVSASVTQDAAESQNGGVAARSGGTLRRVAADVSVTVNTSEPVTGGLVGRNDGTVVECCSFGTVDAHQDSGGLIGENNTTAVDSYSFVDVSGSSEVGGFCGRNDGTIRRSYATGSVFSSLSFNEDGFANFGTVVDCFSIEASGTATQLTTSEMQGDSVTTKMSPLNYGGVFSPVVGNENASGDGFPILRLVDLGTQDTNQSVSINSLLPPLESLSATLQSGSVPPTDVSWSRLGETDATRLYRSDVASPSFPSDFTQIDTLAGDADSVSDAAIVNDDTFTYRVTAVVDGTESQASNADDVTTVVPLESLSAVSADLDGPGVELSWTLNYTTLDAIEVYRTEGTGGTFPDDYTNTDTVSGGATDTEDTTVDAETDYTYRLTAAIDDVGESDPTAADTASLGSIGPFIVTITATNSPVDSGETLSVDYELENQGEFTGDASIDLEVTPQ